MLQAADRPTTRAPCPADGAILVPTELAATPTTSTHHTTCSQGMLHVHRTELIPLRPSFSEDPPSLVTASAAASNGVFLRSEGNGQQVVSHLDYDHPDSLVQTATAGTIESIVDDLVEDALLYHDIATDCVVDAVMEQLISEAICDTEAVNHAMNQRREAAVAVDSILDQLVNDAVADEEAAQIEVVDIVLDDLVSKAVLDVDAAQAELLSDFKLSQAVDTVLQQVISRVSEDVRDESAAAMCQLLTTQSHAGEPGDSLSKDLSMQSTGEAGQAVGPHTSYLQHDDALSSQAAARQKVQQLRRKMEQLSRSIRIQTYQVAIPVSHLPTQSHSTCGRIFSTFSCDGQHQSSFCCCCT